MGKDEILDKRSEYIQELFDDEINYIDLMPGNFADLITMKDQVGASIKLLKKRKSCRVRPHKSGPT